MYAVTSGNAQLAGFGVPGSPVAPRAERFVGGRLPRGHREIMRVAAVLGVMEDYAERHRDWAAATVAEFFDVLPSSRFKAYVRAYETGQLDAMRRLAPDLLSEMRTFRAKLERWLLGR